MHNIIYAMPYLVSARFILAEFGSVFPILVGTTEIICAVTFLYSLYLAKTNFHHKVFDSKNLTFIAILGGLSIYLIAVDIGMACLVC